ncbi:MAG: acetyl-CoA carboxylase biotin carboxyl carrier protein [Planctomycetes bacterium]|nr:acetyl-CoA carboxylase biotin carboxyl carrier protein [Planctomycetota bacterium]
MDLDEIEKLVRIMNENHLTELEYEDSGKKVRLRKGGDERNGVAAAPAALPPPGPALPGAAAGAAGAGPASDLTEVTSPLVGTYYRSARPDAKPFVQVGEDVQTDRVLCIVEAMKVMNEIKADFDCVIREILVKNGDPVEFGQPLFRVKKK